MMYVVTTIIFMLNLLIAKLNCSYQPTYSDMVGFARLNRGWIVTETTPSVARKRWTTFVVGLKLGDRVEFSEGDLGSGRRSPDFLNRDVCCNHDHFHELNLLIAQLNCSYQPTYLDMVGFARLNRGWIVIETMPSVARERWTTFVVGLKLEDRVEFGVGDLGLAGGLRIFSIVTYVVSTITFMLNLLIAQLNCSHQPTYLDVVGLARLNRGWIVTETMPSVARKRWTTFGVGLKLEDCVELGVGDLGLAGGFQTFSIVTYVVTTIIFMLNLLIAKLNCPYQPTPLDMVGFARLNRGRNVTETMPSVARKRWTTFVVGPKLEDRGEFGV